MLDDPRAKSSLDESWRNGCGSTRCCATRDRRRFSDFNTVVAGGMVEETRRLFNHLVWNDLDFMEFFTADFSFINSELARLYGLPEPRRNTPR